MPLFSKRVKATRIMTVAELDEAVLYGKPVLVDFWKPGCQPCRTMDGIVDELADEFAEVATVIKASLQHVPDLFARFKVRSTPTFLVITRDASGIHMRFRYSGLIKKDQLAARLQQAVDST